MKSGGTITFDPSKAVDTAGGDRTKWSENELKTGLVADAADSRTTITDSTIVNWNGFSMTWGQLKQQLMGRTITAGQSVAGANISPEQVSQQSGAAAADAQRLSNELKQLNDAKTGSQTNVTLTGSSTSIPSTQFAAEITTRQQRLQQLLMQMEQSSNPAVSRSDAAHEWYRQAGLQEPSNGNGGTGTFRAMSVPDGSQQGPSGGVPAGNGGGARAMGGPAGFGSAGDPLFAGMQPPSSAAYANALYMDSVVSDGMGNVLRNSSEGRKMMMLFFYYARRAESGDLGDMYQFMKFITHIITKDKARQNIGIGTKLIQLQDMDRKATEALTSAPSDDPNKMNEFTKILQRTQSEQRMIATDQKLMADMSQEMSTVGESLIGMTKAMQEAWARALRIVTSR